MINILNLPRFSKTSFAIVLLLVTALALPAAAQTLTPPEIDALKAKLVEARIVYNALDARVQCYVDKDADFQARSSQLQRTAGDLRRQERKLSEQLEQAKSKAEAFRRDLDAIRLEMVNQNKKMRRIKAQIRGRQAALDDCKSKVGIFGFMCDWAGEIIGLNGELRKLSAESRAIDSKARSLQNHFREAQSRHKDAAERFQRAQIASARTKEDITAVDAEIKEIKKSLSKIRKIKQDYAAKLREFQDTITEFEGLDLGSDRRSIVRRLHRESAYLDDLLAKARLLLQNGLQLPSGERICAN